MRNEKYIRRQLHKKSLRGGKVYLAAGEYLLGETLVMDTSSSTLEGESWTCNVDPNGVFESPYGTKLKLCGKDFPAITVGKQNVLSGVTVKNIGIQGDIFGMDTRVLFDSSDLSVSAGIFIENMRIDQCEFSKISGCGLSVAICAKGDCFVDACTFEKINADGCCIGIYFAPRLCCFTRFRQFVVADTPSYGIFIDGENAWLDGMNISEMMLIRNCGSSPITTEEPAAVYLKKVSGCIFRDNVISDAGTFWFYSPDSVENDDRQIYKNQAVGLKIVGNHNQVHHNKVVGSSREEMVIEGDKNILMNNVVDADVVICGRENVVHSLAFTEETGHLILIGEAAASTEIFAVNEERIVRI